MGGNSTSKDAQLDRFGQLLTSQEKAALRLCFLAIAGSQEAESFTEDKLEAYLGLHQFSFPKEVIAGLFRALCGDGKDRITFANFIVNGSQLLKGSVTQKAQLLCKICSGTSLSLAQVKLVLLAFVNAILSCDCAKEVFPQQLKVWPVSQESSQALVSYLTQSLKLDSQSSDVSNLESCLNSATLILKILETIFGFVFFREVISQKDIPADIRNYLGLDTTTEPGETDRLLLPLTTQHPVARESFQSKLLDQASLILLSSFFLPEYRGTLYPLFSSLHHGESFSTFCKQLLGKGPTLVVVRDTGGHVFGGFAAESWHFNPQFTGNSNCFLFTLLPNMGVYTPTGYNENYMYLQQSAQTLPNGMGMGGQLEYFGLWLSADYGTGHSKARPQCTTYGSPMLSSNEEFQIDLLEVWGVGTPLLPDKEGDSKQTSILDQDKTATALLEMAGKTVHSKGLREPEEGET